MTVTIKQLLEAGVHFGHQTRRWNPKMALYIFGQRNGIYILNLEKTEKELQRAADFVNKTAARGGYVLFVGTKKQAQQIVVEESQRCGMFYVDQRWLGGTLTNFETIRKSVRRLEKLERMRDDGTFEKLKKKEVAVLNKEMGKLLKNLSGIRSMDKLPSAVFVIDVKKEETAVREACRLGIPVVALVDTNSDPDLVDYVIPGNDDAIKSIRLVAATIADAALAGRQLYEDACPAALSAADAAALAEKALTAEETEEFLEAKRRAARKGKKTKPVAAGTKEN
ncbi:MAG: 30S ribosomal protein S2 [Candidatus Omnitrophica bacterium]|nr:30S ribosomal protein S2 [Candidatus Omnitrophota bacterium]